VSRSAAPQPYAQTSANARQLLSDQHIDKHINKALPAEQSAHRDTTRMICLGDPERDGILTLWQDRIADNAASIPCKSG